MAKSPPSVFSDNEKPSTKQIFSGSITGKTEKLES
jgi:hypothetical protein